MILNPVINFEILRDKAKLWGARYPEITQIKFFNSIKGRRPYILLFSLSDTSDISGDYTSNLGMGFKENTSEQRELMECFAGSVDQFEVYSESRFSFQNENGEKSSKTQFINETWFGEQLTKSQFEQIAFTDSEVVLFPMETDDVNAFILKAGGQVDMLYKYAVSKIKTSDRVASTLNVRDIKDYYVVNKLRFQDIDEEDIDAATGRFGGSQQPRDVKGAILLNMVEKRLSEVMDDDTIPSHWQKIWPYYKALKKEKK